MISSTTFAISAVIVAVFYLFFRKDNNKKYPPGPWGLPFIGHLLSVGNKPHISYMEMANRYGSIFTANMGSVRGIVIDDLDIMKEVFNNAVFSGRPDNKAFNILSGGMHGIISSEGEEWIEQRRFTLRQLRNFGFGKKSMEALIMEEVQDILEWMHINVGQPISLNRKFSLSVLNALWAILTGKRFKHDDTELNELFDTSTKTINDIIESGVALFFPKIAEMFPKIFGWDKLLFTVELLQKFFKDTIDQHEKFPGDPHHPRDFIDVYFNEIQKTTNPDSSFYKEAGRRSLLAVIADLHGAGSETTSTTLAWSILYLMKYPNIQKKLQHEIDEVVGKSKLPCLADKPNLPYTESVMYEILRISSIAPTGIFHSTTADTELHGYFIPKDTMVSFNLYSVHHNPKIWGDPENFRPERFLSKDGKTSLKHEELIPFGGGKRVCLGESLARDQFFLYMTSIFQQFEVNLDPIDPNPSLEPDIGFLLAPKKFTVVLTERTI